MLPLPFAPSASVAERPHIMVDGAALPSSVLTLSHWPQSPTPVLLARDVSAASVIAYLRLAKGRDSRGAFRRAGLPGRHGNGRRGPTSGPGLAGRRARELRAIMAQARTAEAVTNDHFDEDGLMSVFALLDPEVALASSALIEAVATCGDFGVALDDRAAAISFAIRPLAEEEAGAGAPPSALYEAVLGRVGELLEHPERFERHYGTELHELSAGREAIERGEVVITEMADLDLAVVERRAQPGAGAGAAAGSSSGAALLPGAARGLPVHAAAVHSATRSTRILAFDGERCEFYLRYEGWVKTVSRSVPLRSDLAPLAARLSSEEPSSIEWEADGVGAVEPRLRPGGEGRTELDPAGVVAVVREYLASGAPAWDPWRPGTAYIPVHERESYRAARPV